MSEFFQGAALIVAVLRGLYDTLTPPSGALLYFMGNQAS
jgi:hypothetical protein